MPLITASFASTTAQPAPGALKNVKRRLRERRVRRPGAVPAKYKDAAVGACAEHAAHIFLGNTHRLRSSGWILYATWLWFIQAKDC